MSNDTKIEKNVLPELNCSTTKMGMNASDDHLKSWMKSMFEKLGWMVIACEIANSKSCNQKLIFHMLRKVKLYKEGLLILYNSLEDHPNLNLERNNVKILINFCSDKLSLSMTEKSAKELKKAYNDALKAVAKAKAELDSAQTSNSDIGALPADVNSLTSNNITIDEHENKKPEIVEGSGTPIAPPSDEVTGFATSNKYFKLLGGKKKSSSKKPSAKKSSARKSSAKKSSAKKSGVKKSSAKKSSAKKPVKKSSTKKRSTKK